MSRRSQPIGRERERAEAAQVLDVARGGPAALVLTGPAGIGKSTIWRAMLDDARERGFITMETRAVETEAQLAFSGLADLLDPVIDDVIDELPPAQRAAIEVALQRVPVGTSPPPPLAVSMATIATMRRLAERTPILVAVDDLPWLDQASAHVLEYTLRRVGQLRLAFMGAVRTPTEDTPLPELAGAFDGPVRVLRVGPLDVEAIDELIRRDLGLSLRRPALTHIQQVSMGNPFFALEVAKRTSGSEAMPGVTSSMAAASSSGLVRQRLADLPPSTRYPLAVIAALGRPTLRLVRAVSPSADEAIDAAIAAEVLESRDEPLTFSHPLLAEAAYAALDGDERRALHATLAEVVSDVEERAQHLALATEGTDEHVAVELERAAEHALGRGGSDAAATFAVMAAQRTAGQDGDAMHRRVLHAARLLIRAGDPERARTLLDGHLAHLDPGTERAETLVLLADVRSSDDWHAKSRVLEEALAEAADDHRLRAGILDELVMVKLVTATDGPGMLALADAAVEEAEAQADPVTLCHTYQAALWGHWRVGNGVATEMLERVLTLAPHVQHERVFLWPAMAKALLDGYLGDHAAAVRGLLELREVATQSGDWDSLAQISFYLANAELWLGAWEDARAHALEAERASRLNSQAHALAQALSQRALVEATLGHEEEARRIAEETIAVSRACGGRWCELDGHAALGFLELSMGNAEAAVVELGAGTRPLIDEGFLEPEGLWMLPDLAEALILLDRVAEAADLLADYEAAAVRLDRISARARSLRVRGLLAAKDGDEVQAEVAFAAALVQHARISEPFEEARTMLALGQVRRRHRRRGQAREAIGVAVEAFERLGARLWLERARAELARTGHRDVGSALSATERQIAELVVSGRTNREAAETLFMSPHTVEAHLTRVYRKLGIRGRAELARVLAAGPVATAGGLEAQNEGVG